MIRDPSPDIEVVEEKPQFGSQRYRVTDHVTGEVTIYETTDPEEDHPLCALYTWRVGQPWHPHGSQWGGGRVKVEKLKAGAVTDTWVYDGSGEPLPQ